jgi:hypothetical protein
MERPQINLRWSRRDVGSSFYFHFLPYEDLIYEDLIEAQHSAEVAQPGWEFDDPQRVASEALARLVKIDQTSTEGMKQTRTSQGRKFTNGFQRASACLTWSLSVVLTDSPTTQKTQRRSRGTSSPHTNPPAARTILSNSLSNSTPD